MSRLDEIEKAIAELPSDEIAKLRNWFDKFDAGLWDDQIERDAKEGRLDDLARQALEDHKAGRTKKL